MATKPLVLLVILALLAPASLQQKLRSSEEVDDSNPFAEIASALLNEQKGQNIGAMVNNFLESGGGKQIGDAISNLGAANAGQLMQGLGGLMAGGDGNSGGFDPAMIGTLMGMMNLAGGAAGDANPGASARNAGGGGDPMNDILSLAGSFFGQPGNTAGAMEMLPMLIQTLTSFVGPEADKRAEQHSGHSWMLPPILEKVHILFDHFLHSDLARKMINIIGAEKTFKIFTDEKGRFSYEKFGELMENHSFRKHWISMVTSRLANFLAYLGDPKIQKKYFMSLTYFANNFFKSQGFPKSAMFDPSRPAETATAFVNHASKRYLQIKFSSKPYIKPAVEYIQDILRLAHQQGDHLNENSRELSDKLADTINLEIIEPIARVNRAYRFAKNHPVCDRYVFCLVNEENPNEQVSLPGLKSILTKGSSLAASWFLSGHTGTPFWTLYNDIGQEARCKSLFLEKCHDFHVEEEKVTTEYVHNEL